MQKKQFKRRKNFLLCLLTVMLVTVSLLCCACGDSVVRQSDVKQVSNLHSESRESVEENTESLNEASPVTEHPEQNDMPQQTEGEEEAPMPVAQDGSASQHTETGGMPETTETFGEGTADNSDDSSDGKKSSFEQDQDKSPSGAYEEFLKSGGPEYTGKLVEIIHNDEPFFTEEEKSFPDFEEYSPLDELGRCGAAFALITKKTMPDEERGDISMVRPSGWKQRYYQGVHAYERCHLIAFMLAGENDNERNLITGTHMLNVEGMLPYESQVAQYIYRFNGSVLYRVTPVFRDDELVARGVLMEAYSRENSKECTFAVYVHNVSRDFNINYRTGETFAKGKEAEEKADYVLNTKTMKFHLPSCESVSQISDRNRQNFVGTRAELIAKDYTPCGSCKP